MPQCVIRYADSRTELCDIDVTDEEYNRYLAVGERAVRLDWLCDIIANAPPSSALLPENVDCPMVVMEMYFPDRRRSDQSEVPFGTNENVWRSFSFEQADSRDIGASLEDVWNSLNTPIYRVIDDNGVANVFERIRKVFHGVWISREKDCFEIVDVEHNESIRLVPEEVYVEYDYDENDNVVKVERK